MIVLIIHFYASSFDSILFIIHTDIFTCHYRDSLESEINTAIMWYLNLTALINCGWKIFVRINNTSLHTLSTHTSSFTYQIGFHPAFVILFEQRIINASLLMTFNSFRSHCVKGSITIGATSLNATQSTFAETIWTWFYILIQWHIIIRYSSKLFSWFSIFIQEHIIICTSLTPIDHIVSTDSIFYSDIPTHGSLKTLELFSYKNTIFILMYNFEWR